MGKGNDENVDWRLRFDVPNSKNGIVSIEKVHGNFSRANFTEDTVIFGHGMPM